MFSSTIPAGYTSSTGTSSGARTEERDLMFIGGGISSDWRGSRHEQLFYRSMDDRDRPRRHRLLPLRTHPPGRRGVPARSRSYPVPGGADREEVVHYFASNFQPGSTIDIALESVRGQGLERFNRRSHQVFMLRLIGREHHQI
ncbi:MAG: hypothetical protein R2849_15755 [Thermomicrobiales bacterium]